MVLNITMNKIIKIGNWWFLEDDVTRFKDHADTAWGEVVTNKSMAETIDLWFAGRTQHHAVDIGANIGFMTAYFAQRWQHVTAFEPTPAIFACLEKNCTRDNIDLKPLALSDKTDTVIFAVGRRSEINQIVSSADILSKHWFSIEVPAVTLDSLNLTGIDMIKIDVEGHELSVLRGAEQTIRGQRPLIAIEISFENKVLDKELNKDHTTALDLLSSWGYKQIWHDRYDYIMEPA